MNNISDQQWFYAMDAIVDAWRESDDDDADDKALRALESLALSATSDTAKKHVRNFRRTVQHVHGVTALERYKEYRWLMTCGERGVW